jgi:hypothetical protein
VLDDLVALVQQLEAAIEGARITPARQPGAEDFDPAADRVTDQDRPASLYHWFLTRSLVSGQDAPVTRTTTIRGSPPGRASPSTPPALQGE